VVRLVKKGGGSVTFGFFLPPLIFSLAGLVIHTVLLKIQSDPYSFD
jgi:hypothetical protein